MGEQPPLCYSHQNSFSSVFSKTTDMLCITVDPAPTAEQKPTPESTADGAEPSPPPVAAQEEEQKTEGANGAGAADAGEGGEKPVTAGGGEDATAATAAAPGAANTAAPPAAPPPAADTSGAVAASAVAATAPAGATATTAAPIPTGLKTVEDDREQDRFLPIANISRIMKKALPPNAKIAKDAKETVQECVSEFISFITSEGAGARLQPAAATSPTLQTEPTL